MAGPFSDGLIEQVRAASDIVEIIGAVVPLKRAGVNFSALCPFHKEKSPSFNVNPSRQIFHCFGCHKGGDVFRFVQDYENIGFVDAVRRRAERAKITVELDPISGGLETRRHIIAAHAAEGNLVKRSAEAWIVHHADFMAYEPFKTVKK